RFPAFIFNSTWVETGLPVAISTTQFPNKTAGGQNTMGINGFREFYPNFDIRVSTAARLSASFPYVSPASRFGGSPITFPDRHLVDGGYFDNFGIYSLLAWLKEALHGPGAVAAPPKEILIIQIRSFPDGEIPTAENHAGRSQTGWFAQSLFPLQTVLHTRES